MTGHDKISIIVLHKDINYTTVVFVIERQNKENKSWDKSNV